jgi:hypothetical protein
VQPLVRGARCVSNHARQPRSRSEDAKRRPNAGAHLMPEAGARHERALRAVRCSALVGARCARDSAQTRAPPSPATPLYTPPTPVTLHDLSLTVPPHGVRLGPQLRLLPVRSRGWVSWVLLSTRCIRALEWYGDQRHPLFNTVTVLARMEEKNPIYGQGPQVLLEGLSHILKMRI